MHKMTQTNQNIYNKMMYATSQFYGWKQTSADLLLDVHINCSVSFKIVNLNSRIRTWFSRWTFVSSVKPLIIAVLCRVIIWWFLMLVSTHHYSAWVDGYRFALLIWSRRQMSLIYSITTKIDVNKLIVVAFNTSFHCLFESYKPKQTLLLVDQNLISTL